MVEYHGWFSVHQSIDGEDEEGIENTAKSIRLYIDRIFTPNRIMVFQPINGTYLLNFSGIANHRSSDVTEIFELIELIAKTAIGSYGLLHFYDDEDQSGRNDFVVYKLQGGKFEKSMDNLFFW